MAKTIGERSLKVKMIKLAKRSMEVRKKKIAKRQTETKKPEGLKKQSLKDDILSIVNGKKTSKICDCYSVGSSNVYSLICGTFNVQRAHQIYMTTKEKREIGRTGEFNFLSSKMDLDKLLQDGITRLSPIKKYTPFARHHRAKFVVSSPDFIFKDDSFKICEVKTSTNEAAAMKGYLNPSNRDILQVWISMDVYSIAEAQIDYHYYDKQNKQISHIGSILVKKEAEFLDELTFKKTLTRYSVFLKEHFAFLGHRMDEKDIDFFEKTAEKAFKSKSENRKRNSAYVEICRTEDNQKFCCKQLYAFVVGWEGAFENVANYPTWKTTKGKHQTEQTPIRKTTMEYKFDEPTNIKVRKLVDDFANLGTKWSTVKRTMTFDSELRNHILKDADQELKKNPVEDMSEKYFKNSFKFYQITNSTQSFEVKNENGIFESDNQFIQENFYCKINKIQLELMKLTK